MLAEGGGGPERQLVTNGEQLSRHGRPRPQLAGAGPEPPDGQVRVGQGVGEVADHAGRALVGLQRVDHVRGGVPGGPPADDRVELVGPVEAGGRDVQVVVGQQLDAVHGQAQALPLMSGDRGDAHPAVRARIQGQRMMGFAVAVAPAPLDDTLVGVEHDRPLMGAGDRFHRAHVHDIPPAPATGPGQRGLGAHGGGGAGEVARPRPSTGERLAVGLAVEVQVPARRPVLQRSRLVRRKRPREAERREDDHDQSRGQGPEAVGPAAGGARVALEGRDHHVEGGRHPLHLRAVRIQHDAPLVGLEILPGRRTAVVVEAGRRLAERATARRLRHHDVGTAGRQQAGAVGAGQAHAQIEDPGSPHGRMMTRPTGPDPPPPPRSTTATASPPTPTVDRSASEQDGHR